MPTNVYEYPALMAISPPVWVQDWISLIGPLLMAAGVIIPAMRRWLVRPIIKTMREHADQHDLIVRELLPNGSELILPPGERTLSLRTLVIMNRASHLVHLKETLPLIEQYRRDLKERGL